MMRSALFVALLTAAPLVPTHASAVGETCRGEAATVVGTSSSPFPTLRGTEGRDVIVSDNAGLIESYGGDDLICVSGPAIQSFAQVDAGTGDDVVDTTASTFKGVDVTLGLGADTFYGGPASDGVDTGAMDKLTGARLPDTDRDLVDTGGGHDAVDSVVVTGSNPDVIITGAGNDYLHVDGPTATGGVVDAGDGLDVLQTYAASGTVVIDAGAGTAQLDGGPFLGWTSIESIRFLVRDADVTYAGTDAAEGLEVQTDGGSRVTASLAGGADQLFLSAFGSFGTIDVNGGGGRDRLRAHGRTPFAADLRRDTLEWAGQDHRASAFENVSAYGSSVRLVGDDRGNVLEGGPCDTRIQGGGGADDLSRVSGIGEDVEVRCTQVTVVFSGGTGNDRLDGSRYDDDLRGGPGNDRLTGEGGNDTLSGGPGRDRATGGKGRDRCSAEVERSCER